MKVTIVSSKAGDWKALYIDGKLADQGHSIHLATALRLAGLEVETREFEEDEHGDIDVTWDLNDAQLAEVKGL
jgi:hypothetical protein